MGNIWFLLIIIFLIVEVFTIQFVSLGFACGAVLAFAVCQMGAPPLFQILVYTISSFIFWYFIVKHGGKLIAKNIIKTGTYSIVGKKGIIRYRDGSFRVLPDGEDCDWKAESNGHTLKDGDIVRIKGIRGVTLLVTPVENTAVGISFLHTSADNKAGNKPKGE